MTQRWRHDEPYADGALMRLLERDESTLRDHVVALSFCRLSFRSLCESLRIAAQYIPDSTAPVVNCAALSTSDRQAYFERLVDALKRHSARLAALTPPTPATLPNPVTESFSISRLVFICICLADTAGECAELSSGS